MAEAEAAPAAAPAESLRKKLIRAAAQYSIGMLIAMMGSIARVGVTARLLSEEQNGIWLGLQLLLGYAGNLHLGSLYGMFRSVPIKRARGEHADAEREKGTAFTFVLVMTVIGALALLVLAPRIASPTSPRQVGLTMALLATNLLRMYFVTLVKSESRFKELSTSTGVGAVATLLGLLLVVKWRLDGLLMGMLAQQVVEVLYLASRTGIPKLAMERPILKEQLRVGLMTLLITVGVIAVTNADRTIMLRLCGTEATGLYYIGANVVILLPTLAAIPGAVLTPQYFERVGRGESLLPLVERPLRTMAYFCALTCAAGAVALPATVKISWPHHSPGVPAAICALFGTYPIVLAGLVSNVYYALDRQGLHVGILGVSAVLGYAFAAAGVMLMGGAITGAAAGAAVALFLYYAASTIGSLRLAGGTAPEAARLALETLGPAVWAAAMVAIVRVVFGADWLAGSLKVGALATGLVTIAFVPLVPRAVRAFRGTSAAGVT